MSKTIYHMSKLFSSFRDIEMRGMYNKQYKLLTNHRSGTYSYISLAFLNIQNMKDIFISVQCQHWQHFACGVDQRRHHLRLPTFAQSGFEGGDFLEHGEIRNEHRHKPGNRLAASSGTTLIFPFNIIIFAGKAFSLSQ